MPRKYVRTPDRAAKTTGDMTLEEVADRLFAEGWTDHVLSRERIRQVEAKALRKLAAACKAEGISFADLCPRDFSEEPRIASGRNG